MKKVIFVLLVALAVTAGIASAGIASLASGAAILIDATSHSGQQHTIAYTATRNAAGV